MELTEAHIALLARVDERTLAMREEMHNGFQRLDQALTTHVEGDDQAHKRLVVLEQAYARGRGAWKMVVGIATTVAGVAGVAYYVIGVIHGG